MRDSVHGERGRLPNRFLLTRLLLQMLQGGLDVYKRQLLGGTPADSLNGTTVLNTYALLNGANILRVHDVREAVEAIRVIGQMTNK